MALYEEAVRKYAAGMEKRAMLSQAGLPPGPIPEPPEKPRITPWPGLPTWCARCKSVIHTELLELDDLAALILAIPPLARPAETGTAKVSGSRTAPSPSARMDDIAELGEWLRSWEAVARKSDVSRPRRGYLATEMTTVTAWLAAHFDPLINDPDVAGDFGGEIRRWHRDMCRRAAAAQMQRHMKKPCPRCDLYTLWITMGEDYVRCINEECGRMLTRADYEGLSDAA
jgi:hypothetical protein